MSTINSTELADTPAASAGSANAKTKGARVIVLYATPPDPAAFDAYYLSTHVPIASKMPGLRSFLVSRGGVTTPGAASPPYHFLAELHFDSLDAVNAALGSPEGAAAVADIPNFASEPPSITIVELEEVL